jgi:3-deoxy-7-phosphoheptulonate synthase
VRAAAEALVAGGLRPNVMVDCSHANSDKDHRRQELAWNDVVEQRVAGNRHIIGLMLESNLIEGSQQLGDDPSKLRYGVSITDACTGWEKTRELILRAHDALAAVPELAAIP